MKTIEDFFPEFENCSLVKNYFGVWPSLHDSEVIEITLNRELCTNFTGPKMWITFYSFNPTVGFEDPERKESKLVLLFEGIELEILKNFNHQNSMSDFKMEKYSCNRLREERFRVIFGEFGAKIEFTCKLIRVVSIEPYQPIDYFKQEP